MNDRRAFLIIGIVSFAVALLMGLLIQKVVLPLWFPSANLGHGLFSPDSYGFHQIAVSVAANIEAHGWSAWMLRPGGASPSGIAAAIYAVFGAKPEMVLPFNALIHALTGLVVFGLLRQFFPVCSAFVGTVVFLANPVALQWTSQIHRDGFFILGNVLFVFGLLLLSDAASRGLSAVSAVAASLVVLVGAVVTWVARPYWVQIEFLTALAGVAFIMPFAIRRAAGKDLLSQSTVMVVLAAALWALYLLSTFSEAYSLSASEIPNVNAAPQNQQFTEQLGAGATENWKTTASFPGYIEKKVMQIATARNGAISIGGGSIIDADVRFYGISDVIGYCPRALAIGLLAPFPDMWVAKGSSSLMTVARGVVGGMTMLGYVGLVGFVFWLLERWRSSPRMMLSVYCGSCILLFSLVSPNVGTLVRYRYGFYMLMIAIGYAYLSQYWWNRREKNC